MYPSILHVNHRNVVAAGNSFLDPRNSSISNSQLVEITLHRKGRKKWKYYFSFRHECRMMSLIKFHISALSLKTQAPLWCLWVTRKWSVCVCVQSLRRVWLFCTPLDCRSRQAPLSTKFSRQEYWSGLPFPPLGDLPHPGIEPVSPAYALAGGFFTTAPPSGSAIVVL